MLLREERWHLLPFQLPGTHSAASDRDVPGDGGRVRSGGVPGLQAVPARSDARSDAAAGGTAFDQRLVTGT